MSDWCAETMPSARADHGGNRFQTVDERMCVALSTLVLVVSFDASQSRMGGFRWWQDVNVQGALALTAKQVAEIEAEYGRTLEHRRLLRRQFDAANAELTRALARGDLSDADAEPLVTRVEDLRRQRNVVRTQLLITIYFLLTPHQRERLPLVVERAFRIRKE